MDIEYSDGIFNKLKKDAIDFSTDKIVSFSQFTRYNKCPKSWELHYVRKKRFPDTSIHFVYGTAMHRTIQYWLHTLYTKSVKKSNELDLHATFLQELKDEYTKALTENNNIHFSSKEQLSEFFADGCAILDFLKKKRTLYFSSRHTKLMGIELPLISVIDKSRSNVKLQSYLDLVFYDTKLKKYKIIDLKTSTKGWNDYKKKDKNTTDQLVLYKKLLCDKFNIDPNNVDIVYFILKQKIDPDSLWPVKRVSEFKPASGNISMNKVIKSFIEFIHDCFDENGNYIDKSHPAIAGKNYFNCRFCPYNEHEDLCPKSNRITEI